MKTILTFTSLFALLLCSCEQSTDKQIMELPQIDTTSTHFKLGYEVGKMAPQNDPLGAISSAHRYLRNAGWLERPKKIQKEVEAGYIVGYYDTKYGGTKTKE